MFQRLSSSLFQTSAMNCELQLFQTQRMLFCSTHIGTPPTATTKSMKTRSLITLGLSDLAANASSLCYHNLSYGKIADLQACNKEGTFTSNGAFVVNTGKFTGRSAMDKYIVRQKPSEDYVWWGAVNQPMDPATYDILHKEVKTYYQNCVDEIFVFDGFCGANKSSRKKVRFVTETAWHQHFVKNMFIEATEDELRDFGEPDFTVINCWDLVNEKFSQQGLNSEIYITFNVEQNTALIGGAWYGGEMKKGIFSMMHYWLPMKNVLSMHCSANIGADEDVAIFFGLSGTGKTTLSTDPHRRLIGDDEHGWDDTGIFNFEGGCYAKTAHLSRETEPEIYDAVRFNALLENVWVDPYTRTPDFSNMSLTENGRVSYPIDHIDNREDSLSGGHPSHIIFLCCDAFGVLPPVAKLNPGQAMYHFISGYTAKVAGTERGVQEPSATFSPCYGAAFLTLHPMEYGSLFKSKLEQYGTDCYLVNTGWSGGGYSSGGKRMSIRTTRNCLDAIFNGSIKETSFRKDERFGFEVPLSLAGVDSDILDAKNTWTDKAAYEAAYTHLAELFADNISKYTENIQEYANFGPIPL